jgi:hypothetical protein
LFGPQVITYQLKCQDIIFGSLNRYLNSLTRYRALSSTRTHGDHINHSVSLSPLYLILLLILHPRTSSKKRLCVLCVRPIPNRANGKRPAQIKNSLTQLRIGSDKISIGLKLCFFIAQGIYIGSGHCDGRELEPGILHGHKGRGISIFSLHHGRVHCER